MPAAKRTVQTGLDVALLDPHPILRQAKAFGYVSNQASVTSALRHGADALCERFPETLRTLFGPQHGLWSTEQDNMIETGHGSYRGRPVWSLYSESREPTDEMLEGLDLLVIDLLDVGTRVYTYVWTLVLCMRACAARGIDVLVLDRPNPLGGDIAEGARLDLDYQSFVGMAPIPMRHGLTLGELGKYCNDVLEIGCRLHVQEMRGWDRSMLWSDTGCIWVPPSPNLPRFEGALTYPGQVLLEGTNVSEARGTTTPFEQFGAPWLDSDKLREWLSASGGVAGCVLRPVAFEPTFQKHSGQVCRGLFVHCLEPAIYRSYRMTLLILRGLRELHGEDFAWRQPPYEYEHTRLPIDILTGGQDVRRYVDGSATESNSSEAPNRRAPKLDDLADAPADWWPSTKAHRLYPR